AICPFLGIKLLAPSSQLLACNRPLRFRALGAVFRAPLLAVGNTHRVQRAADYVIAHARQILNATASDEHDRVLLQVVADTRNVSRNFNPVREPDARDFSQRRVRLLRCLGIDTSTDPSLLRASL